MVTDKDIRALMFNANWNQADLARELHVSQPTVSRWLTGAVPEPAHQEVLQKIIDGQKSGLAEFFNESKPTPVLVSDANKMPVYASAEGGEGALIISVEPVERAPRPMTLEGISDAYGIVIEGESMDPAYEPGDIAWVNPRLSARRGHDSIFYHIDEDSGLRKALIKRVVGISDGQWTVKQYNPAKEFKLDRGLWSICHRVVGKLNKR